MNIRFSRLNFAKGSYMNDVMQVWLFFWPLPHHKFFYYWGLSAVVTKSLHPFPLRPWRHLRTTPKVRQLVLNLFFRQLLKSSNSEKQRNNKRMSTLKETKEVDDDEEDAGITIKVQWNLAYCYHRLLLSAA